MGNIKKNSNLISILFHCSVFLAVLWFEKNNTSYNIGFYTIVGLLFLGVYTFKPKINLGKNNLSIIKNTIASSSCYLSLFVYQVCAIDEVVGAAIILLSLIFFLFIAVVYEYYTEFQSDIIKTINQNIQHIKKYENNIDKELHDSYNNKNIQLKIKYKENKRMFNNRIIKVLLFIIFCLAVIINILPQNYISILDYVFKIVFLPSFFITASLTIFYKIFNTNGNKDNGENICAY